MFDNISLTGLIVPTDSFYNGDVALGDRALTVDEKDLLLRGSGFEVRNHEIVDISQTQEYKNKMIFKNIEVALQENDEKYENILNTPIEYSNNLFYKPSYVNDYTLLIADDSFPVVIWDSTGMESRAMEKQELIDLKNFLNAFKEPAYQEKKQMKSKLLAQKKQLIS